jgi:chemotaxis family two-component system sensor kinase Cph1
VTVAGSIDPAADAVTAANVDLSNCDREQIHIPGAIQPHGAMLVLAAADLRILQASANAAALLGTPPDATLPGQGIAAALGEAQAGALRDRLAREDAATLETGPVHVLRAALPAGPFDIFAHRADGLLVVELERAEAEPGRLLDLNSGLRAAVARLEATEGLRDFLDLAVRHIRGFTGYDRVLAYEFLEDGSGDVVAEDKAEGLEPYLGLRYPASDIPAPSRRLFALSWLRHLPDARYEPVPLLPEPNPETGRPLDMGRARLRSVSAMYTDYLINMGVRGSTVMPLMKAGRLWGLVSCMHHAGPRHLPYETRLAAEFLAHTLSLLLAAKEDADTYEARLRSGAAIDRLVRGMAGEEVFHHALSAADTNLLSCVEAGGAALAVEGGLVLMGRTPGEEQVRALTGWRAAATSRSSPPTRCRRSGPRRPPSRTPPPASSRSAWCGTGQTSRSGSAPRRRGRPTGPAIPTSLCR